MSRAHKGPAIRGKGRISVNQARFAEEYATNGGNMAAAYRAAYPHAKHDDKTVNVCARDLLRSEKVQAYLAEMARFVDAKLTQKYDASVDRIALELCRIGFADPAGVFNQDTGNLLQMRSMPEDTRRAVSSIKVMHKPDPDDPESVVQVTEIRFWDKNTALGNLAKWKKMLIDRKEVGGPGEFDGMSDEDIDKELAAMETREVIHRARKASAAVPPKKKARPARVSGDEGQ